jgi:ornithine carbamoyltransferase
MAASVSSIESWKMSARDFTSDLDLSAQDLAQLIDLAIEVKRTPGRYISALRGRYLTLLFEKPSLRTRLTFELAIKQLGGDSVLSSGAIGDREPVKDIARNLDRWTHGIVARTFSQHTVDELAKWSSVPVINALSELYHPCQALVDFQTVKEHFGGFAGVKMVFIGDGNNVAHSLMLDAARLGTHFTIACPPGYEPNAGIVAQARNFALATGSKIEIVQDPLCAVAGADVVYTDVWASMGQENEAEHRRQTFTPFQVNMDVMRAASPKSLFMHCLPAKRDQEVTDQVMESSHSVVFDQAENRLHAQKALLLMLLE